MQINSLAELCLEKPIALELLRKRYGSDPISSNMSTEGRHHSRWAVINISTEQT